MIEKIIFAAAMTWSLFVIGLAFLSIVFGG
jgi:hypothetical protein